VVLYAALTDDTLEHRGQRLAPIERRVECPFENRANLIPDSFPFGALTIQIEFGQDGFDPVNQFGVALKPWIGTTLIKKGFNLVHRALTTDVGRPNDRALLFGQQPSHAVGQNRRVEPLKCCS
jgi:hypothetical protein